MIRDGEIFHLVTRLPLFLPTYALVLFRVAGLIATAPLFSSAVIPFRIQAALAGIIALTLFPLVAPTAPAHLGFTEVLLGVAGETVIGVVMGLALNLVLAGTDLAGLLAGQQAGIALGEVFNPMTNSESSAFSQAYLMVFQTVFLLAGGHRALMSALLDTFAAIPVASFRPDSVLTELLVTMLGSACVLGLKLAAPVLTALFLTTLALGFLARTMPQLNILTVGFAVRVMLAIALMSLALPGACDVFMGSVHDAFVSVRSAFGLSPQC